MKEKKTYVTRTGVSFEPELLSKLDEWIKEKNSLTGLKLLDL